MENIHNIIITPLITEKGTTLRDNQNKYIFKVYRDANKIEIAKAVESIFKVKVLKVNTMVVKGKKRRMGRFEGKRPDWKKAVVTVKKGDSIKAFEGA